MLMLGGREPWWKSSAAACVALAALTLSARTACCWLTDGPKGEDPDSYLEMANQVLRHHTLAVDHRPTDGSLPTASRAPLYPLMLALSGLVKGRATLMGVMAVNSLLLVATVVFTWLAGRRLWPHHPWAALVAGAVAGVDPIAVHYSQHIAPETLALASAAFIFWRMVELDARSTIRNAILVGVSVGLATLGRPTFLLMVPVLALVALFLGHKQRPAGWWPSIAAFKVSSVLALSAVLVILPWPLRNLIVLGEPIATTSHGGSTLALGNCPEMLEVVNEHGVNVVHVSRKALDRFVASSPVVKAYLLANNDPVPPPPGTERAADQWLAAQGQQFIRDHPKEFLWLAWARLKLTWSVVPPMKLEDADQVPQSAPMELPLTIWYAGIYTLALAGWWMMRGLSRTRGLWWTGTMLVLVISVFAAVYFGGPRMRAPVMPWLCLLSSNAMVVVFVQARLLVRRGRQLTAPQPVHSAPTRA